MRDKDMTHKQAAQFVKTLDGQLIKWTRLLYGVDWQDPSLYDAVLSLDRLSVDGAAETIAAMTELREFRPTEASRKAFAEVAGRVPGVARVDNEVGVGGHWQW